MPKFNPIDQYPNGQMPYDCHCIEFSKASED